MLRVLPVVLLCACVVRYGPGPEEAPLPAEPQPPPVDYAELLERLDALSVSLEDIDRRDRLDAARSLARRMESAEPRAQRAVLSYLRQVIAIEERATPVQAPAMYQGEEASFIIGAPIVEEELDVEPSPAVPTVPGGDEESGSTPPPAAPAAPAGEAGPEGDAVLARARDAQAGGDLPRALSELETCRGQRCWPAVEAEWRSVRDRFVAQEREQAGVQYLRARNEPDAVVRLQALRDIRQRLADLLDRYPDSPVSGDLRRNVDLVQRAIETTVDAQQPEPDPAASAPAPGAAPASPEGGGPTSEGSP